MNIINNKKGVVFTIIAIVLAIFFTLIFSARVDKPLNYKTEILETRISLLSDYMSTFFDYAEGTASIAGYSALRGIIINISNASEYDPNFEAHFSYCIRTGNLTPASICPNMTNQTLAYFLDTLRNLGMNELNIKSNYTLNSISINQTPEDAFSIQVTVNITVNITDGYANMSYTRALKSNFSIEGLLDPLYLLNGTYNQIISIYQKLEENWTYTDLQNLYYNHKYRWYRYQGISFLDRVRGNLVPSYYGIESFVNYTHPGVTSTYDYNDSMADYQFWLGNEFNCMATTLNSEVLGINDSINFPLNAGFQHFQLDRDHATIFVSGYLLVSPCP